MNESEERFLAIKPSVPTVPKEWSDRLYEKQMQVVAAMNGRWLLHPSNQVRKVPQTSGFFGEK